LERLSLNISKTIYTLSIKSPRDAYIAFAEKGTSNAKMQKCKILHQLILGGCYVRFGGFLSLVLPETLEASAQQNPGIPKMAFVALFPVNLLLIMMTGGQVCVDPAVKI
jgi:formate/nitrite transporter FocA (FNT family)